MANFFADDWETIADDVTVLDLTSEVQISYIGDDLANRQLAGTQTVSPSDFGDDYIFDHTDVYIQGYVAGQGPIYGIFYFYYRPELLLTFESDSSDLTPIDINETYS
ncbi:MAG: hypothetical protein ACTFAK_08535 [Candidatus Electronema sp. VV]